ncbi:MAG: fibronectin type III domain-containing protein, partial [Longimicrobiales bacterium]
MTNAGGGALTGLSTAITYGAGQSSGWLSATLSTTTAPATLTLRAGASGLPTGVYNATVGVSSPIAQNTPQNISVTFTIGGAQPAIAVVPRLLGFSAVRGTANPPAQNLDVTNVGGASLTGLAVSVTYPGQQPGGWLTSSVSQGTAPATITVSATTGSLPTGTYTAALGVTSPVAMNSPQTVDVTFNVLEPPPSTPATLSATPVSPAQINLAWAAASGVVVRYRIERKTGAAGTYAVIDSVASSATTYNNTGLSSATLYGYRVRACNTTGCSTPTAEANATSLPIPPAGLTPTTASTTQINLSWTTSAGTVTNYRVERSATSGTGFAEIGTVTGTAYQSTGLTAATPYFYQLRACNAGGCSAYTPQSTAVT